VVDKVSWVQIDVMDGLFVTSTSWPYHAEDIAPFFEMVQKKEMLPYLDSLSYEVDIMTEHPEDEIPKWYALGARRFLVHFESIDDIDVLEHIILTYSKKGISEVGIALDVKTPIESIEPILREIDCVQLMGIAHIGYQGEPFDERVIDRVKRLREVYKNGIISVDGAVSLMTAPRLLEAGVDRLVSGSAIFASEDVSKTIEAFKNL
jgi:ribulose-phosphate 3-epimerase